MRKRLHRLKAISCSNTADGKMDSRGRYVVTYPYSWRCECEICKAVITMTRHSALFVEKEMTTPSIKGKSCSGTETGGVSVVRREECSAKKGKGKRWLAVTTGQVRLGST
jgi:hypothetical protein